MFGWQYFENHRLRLSAAWMPTGSLQGWIHGVSQTVVLKVLPYDASRLNIFLASALQYHYQRLNVTYFCRENSLPSASHNVDFRAQTDAHVVEAGAPALTGLNPSESEALAKLEDLQAAFSFFNETSSQLANSYKHLEARVAGLSRELKQANEEKADEQFKKKQIAHRMQALLEFLPGGVVVLDQRGVIIESNPAARSLLGGSLDGRLWREVIAQCFAPRKDDGFEVSTRNGKRISIATESLDGEGQIILLTDQTETRELQQNLYRQQRLTSMGKMVSALAHQIRTPLSAALLYAGHLCQQNISAEQRQYFSSKVLGRLQHMENQVRDMMLFVRSELPLNDVIPMADLELGLREAMDAPLLISQSRCDWRNDCPHAIIRCNREALIGATMNLVNNAIQASEDSSDLTITFNEIVIEGVRKIQVSIKDKGPGMGPELLDKVKELFVTTKPQGTGLGLAVVMSVAKAHGGAFRLESEPGIGTDAILIFPAEVGVEPAEPALVSSIKN